MNVVLFSGGSGNANLIKYIKNISYVNLSILINGYDDGLSTGIIRNANYGMLGPSDFRKNFSYIIDEFTDSDINIKNIFEYRLNTNDVEILINSNSTFINSILSKFNISDNDNRNFISKYLHFGLTQLLNYTQDKELFNGFSLGNILIGGIYFETNDFNDSLSLLTEQFNLNARLINVTRNDDSKLVAFDSFNNFLNNESDIVNYKGDQQLKSFYLIPLSKIESCSNDSLEKDIKNISHIPNISITAKNAISNADIIIFGTGTLFSSLLPSYRICKNDIIQSKSKKFLIINNQFDNDINNITLKSYIALINNELDLFENIDFYHSIIMDRDSVLNLNNIFYRNLIIDNFSNNHKHNGQKIWDTIINNIDKHNNFIRVFVNIDANKFPLLEIKYKNEINHLNSDDSRNIKYYIKKDQDFDFKYELYINTYGKIQISEIDIWVQILQKYQFDVVIGSRFDSRKQLVASFKKNLVESNFNYKISLISSYIVSLFYFIRFTKLLPDPLSGIYLTKYNNLIYDNIPNFLKKINDKKNIQIVSLPIGYRTFKDQNLLIKFTIVIKNIFKLYV